LFGLANIIFELAAPLGVHLGFGGADDVETLRKMIQKVEELGFDGVFVSEGLSDQPLDPFGLLSLASTFTERLALGIVDYSLTLRHPVVTAKSVSSLQRLSEGRVILGVDLTETESAGSSPQVGIMGALESECLEIVHRAWRDETLNYQGKFFRVEGMKVSSQLPANMAPHVWIEGRTTTSVMAASRYASGLVPKNVSKEDVSTIAVQLKNALKHAARGSPFVFGVRLPLVLASSEHRAQVLASYYSKKLSEPLESFLSHALVGDAAKVTEKLTSYFESGVNYALLSVTHMDTMQAQLEALSAFSRDVAPSL
jgi:alkanesulfonate monooxygenase SsuD/methylene tetrahydromethanopterin reductase-like flavin-dependent oxidoreductase (luciferase family)